MARSKDTAFELVALVVMTTFAALFIRTERTISRAEGGTVLALYVLFAAFTIAKG